MNGTPRSVNNPGGAGYRRRRVLLKVIGMLMVAAALGLTASGAGAGDAAAFAPGEKLVYELRWTFIPAGRAALEVQPMETVDGVSAYHFVMTAQSNEFVDAFYKVRDRIDAYADADLTHSVRYRKDQHEGSTQRKVTVTFDWAAGTSDYRKVEKEGTEEKTIPLKPGSFDPLSAFFFVRSQPLKVGATVERPITDGKKNVVGRVRVIRRETIRVAGKTYDTLLIEPDLQHIGGVFKESKDARMRLWVTADHRHIPVRLKSKVVVGSFVGDLVEATGIR